MPELIFLPNAADIDEGLGDAGVETFRDTPYASVARECGQNSADARAATPVKVSFDTLEIPVSDLPACEQYRSAVRSCLEKARTADNEKEIDFFKSASETLTQETIKILRISDFNTRGLSGPCVPGTAFHSLLKASGVSTKDQEDSGGSFGIGKNAAFAVSNIQTVFYSTVYVDSQTGNENYLCQGKSILVSHNDENDEPRLARGYWGEDGFQPVIDPAGLPNWLIQEEVGTSLYCIGFRDTDDWRERITASLLQNFFCAIHRGEMEFSVNDNEIRIKSDTLADLFRERRFEIAATDSGSGEDYTFSRNLLECLTAIEAREEIVNVPGLGAVSIRVLVREGLPKRIGIIRNGMFITDNLNHFGHKFVRFPLYKEFVAFVEPVDTMGDTLMKKLENPRHDSFSAERLADPDKRKQAHQTMKKLGDKIRETIKSHTLEPPQSSIDLNELSEFFADEINPEKIQDPDALEDNPEKPIYRRAKPVKPKTPVSGPDEDEAGGAGGNSGDEGTEGGEGSGHGGGTGGTGNRGGGRILIVEQVRNLPVSGNPDRRRIYFTPRESAPAMLNIYATGIHRNELLTLTSADKGEIEGQSLQLDLRKDERMTLEVNFRDSYDGPIEVICRSRREVTSENQ